VLAARMLHLTKDEAVFECATGMNCECGALHDYQQDELHGPRQTLLSGRMDTDVHHIWRDLAMKYSQKSITHKTDGLRALTGIATKWSSTSTGRYLAGLWEKDILNHLRWLPLKEDPGERTRYVTPSWSWISVHRPVRWAINERPGLEYYIEVDMSKSECHSSELNPFGDVTCGYLHVTGKVASVMLSIDKHDRPCIEKPGIQPRDLFRQFDSLSRCRQAHNTEVFCLLFCNKGLRRPNQTDQYSALVVGQAAGEVLRRQPQHVQAFGHVYQRLGILDRLEADCWDKAQRISMYLI
jgi:hypothetical protein